MASSLRRLCSGANAVRNAHRADTSSEADLQDKDRARILESARLPHTLAPLVFLGIDDRTPASHQGKPAKVDPLCPEGIPYFALDVGKDGAEYEKLGGVWGDARGSANAMDGWTAGVFAQARALIDWNVRNKVSLPVACCRLAEADNSSVPLAEAPPIAYGRGGSAAVPLQLTPSQARSHAFRSRVCTTSPTREQTRLVERHDCFTSLTYKVIIMGILNAAGDRMLLGRQSKWPKGMYSCLAGFVEPGESFEDAVRREVMEEAGIEVGPVR